MKTTTIQTGRINQLNVAQRLVKLLQIAVSENVLLRE
jgi:hypothetical protein